MEPQINSYYPHYDQVGSLRAISDASGAVVKQIDYDSFGNVISDTNISMTTPFGFAGGMHDHDTGLVRFGFRDYDPAIGRWTAKDPIDFAGGDVNLFQYAAADPVNFNDPFGLLVVGTYNQSTGLLILRDIDTGETVSARYFSGGLFGAPVPNGSYDILGHGGRKDFYRLEPIDTPYGDDTHQRAGRDEFRLHKPGGSRGCITAEGWDQWRSVQSLIEQTKTSTAVVPSKWLNPIKRWMHPTEALPWYGSIVVTGSS